jgi:hypothetical protein
MRNGHAAGPKGTPEASALSLSFGLVNSGAGLFGGFLGKVTLNKAATVGGPKSCGALGSNSRSSHDRSNRVSIRQRRK